MGKQIKILTVNELKEGMVIAKKVEQNGSLLINSDVEVTKSIINRLKRMYFFGDVQVYDEQNDENKSDDLKEVSIKSNSQKNDLHEKKVLQKNLFQKNNDSVLDNIYDSKYRRVEIEFTNMANELVGIFDRIVECKGKIGIEDIKIIELFVERIQNELKSTSSIIKSIVLKGSGYDSIYRHSVNVAALSALIGIWTGLEEYKMKSLIYTALLHDCGKVMVNEDILNKETALTNEEFITIKKHTTYGYNLVKNIAGLDKHISYGVLMHHERLDGSGYPLGATGEGIHPFAKIVAIADMFDAINSNRGYKDKKAPFEAMQIIKNESVKKLDSKYSQVFLEHITNYYMGEEAILNNGESCKIMQVDIDDLENPIIFKNGKFIDLKNVNNLYVKELKNK